MARRPTTDDRPGRCLLCRATARPNTSYAVAVAAASQNAPVVNAYAVNDSTTQWTIRFQTAPSSGVTYSFSYVVVEATN